jgi:hypothetical protein
MHPEQILLVVLISVFGALAVGRIFRIAELYKKIQDREADTAANPCPPHTWGLNHTGAMICGKCNSRPGEQQ